MPIDVDLPELERRLGLQAPRAYVRWLNAVGPDVAARRALDPKTLCVINLGLRMTQPAADVLDRFFLGGDGCGNYYFVDARRWRDRVLLLAHDPPGIEDADRPLGRFLADYEQNDRIALEAYEDEFRITRTDVVGEAPLLPITLDEWVRAVPGIPGIRHVGARIGTNPFTGAELRIPAPGLSIVEIEGREHHVWWWAGALGISRAPPAARPVAEAIATALGARVTAGRRSRPRLAR